MTDPVDQLRRAAHRIEQLAADATAGPWTWEAREDWGWGDWHTVTAPTAGHDVARGGYEGGGVEREEDAAWICTLNPLIAASLAALLGSAADDLEATARSVWSGLAPAEVAARADQEWFRRPLALARAILQGGDQP